MFFRSKKSGKYENLQIVENYRDENGKTRQRVLLTWGNMQTLKSSGQLDSLLASSQSGGRLSISTLLDRNPLRK